MILPSKIKHTATVIMLHGLGDTGAGWADFAFQIQSNLPYTKWILPDAPIMPVTLNNGHKMSSWYDIKALDTKTDHDEEGILSSSIKIKAIIESESKLVGYNRIILAGFSQGAVMTMATAFKLPHKLGGIMCLSGYMPYPDKFQSFMVDENLEGLFMAHGTDDQVVKYKWGKDSFEKLESFGVKGVFKMYPGMGHGSCSKEVSDILSYLKQRLEQRHEL